MGRKKKADSKILTEAELRIMTVLWKEGPSTVHQVLDFLGSDYAYNTASTIIRILEQKEFLSSRKEGRSHIYAPLIKKEDYESIGLENVVEGLFEGTPLNLVKRLIGAGKLSQDDLKELKKLLK